MAVSTVIAALQARHALLMGVTSAPTAMPASLASSMLPIAVVIPGEAEWTKKTMGRPAVQTRTYHVRVYVAPVAQGQGLDEGFSAATALLETFGDSYAATQAMGTGYRLEFPFADSGHQIMQWGEAAYHGFEFRLRVAEAA